MFRNLLSLHNRRIANSVMEKDPQPSQEDPRIFLRFKNPVSFQIPGMLLLQIPAGKPVSSDMG